MKRTIHFLLAGFFLMILLLGINLFIKAITIPNDNGDPIEGQSPLGENTYVISPEGLYLAPRDHGPHSGVDLVHENRSATINAPVYPADGGVVIAVSREDGAQNYGDDSSTEDLGNTVVVYHTGTGYLTVYGHLNTIDVTVGENVNRDTTLGRVGVTCRSPK